MKQPRIALLSDAEYPFSGADTFQVIKNADALFGAGLDITLVIPRRSGRVFVSREKRLQELKDYYNLKNPFPIVQLLSIPAARSRMEKLTHNLIGPLYTIIKKIDVVYTRQPSAAILSFFLGKEVILEAYRLMGSEFPRFFSILKKIGLFKHPRFLGCITHSRIARKDFIQAGVPAQKVVVMYNGFDQDEIRSPYSKEQARETLGLQKDGTYIVYAGNMQPSKGIETILDIASQCREYKFYFVGGREKHIKRLKKYVAEKNIENTIFTGFKNNRDVAKYLQAADALIIPPTIKALQHGRTVLPIKLFIYLAAGRPIIAPRQVDIEELLTHGKTGLLVEPDNLEEAVNTVRKIVRDRELNNDIGREALKFSANFTWEKRAQQIKEWLLHRLGIAE